MIHALEISTPWTIGLGFGSAALGALVGAATITLMELWKRVLDGVLAARLLRMEMVRLQISVDATAHGKTYDPDPLITNWQNAVVMLAPLMNENELMVLSREYLRAAQAKYHGEVIKKAMAGGDQADGERSRKELEDLKMDLKRLMASLEELEGRSKVRHMWRVARGVRTGTLGPAGSP